MYKGKYAEQKEFDSLSPVKGNYRIEKELERSKKIAFIASIIAFTAGFGLVMYIALTITFPA